MAYSSLQRALATPRPSCRLQTLAWLLCILALLTACRGLTWSKAQENPCSESTLKWCYTILHTWNCTRFPDLSISISTPITFPLKPDAILINTACRSIFLETPVPVPLETTCRFCQWHLVDLADLAPRNAPGSGATRWCAHRRALGAASWGGGTTCVRFSPCLGWLNTTFWSLNWCWNVFKQREIQDIFKKTTTSNRFIDIQWITELESQYFVYSSREMSRVRSKKITSCVHELHAWYLLLPGGPSIHSRSFYSYLLQVGIDMYTYK